MTPSSLVRNVLGAIDRLCAYDHCRLPAPWFVWRTRNDPASRLRRRILALDYGSPLASAGAIRALVAAALHILRGTREIFLVWQRQKAACKRGYGVSPQRQFAQLFSAAFRYNFPPTLYYRARLFRLERHRWNAIFSHEETTLILATFEHARNHSQLWTKRGWAAYCATEGIAAVPIAAEADNGTLVIRDPSMVEPGRDLFLKPDRDYSGRGGVMLEWDASAEGWRALGAASGFVARDALPAFLSDHSRGSTIIVQPRLRNVAALADLASRALVNIRIVTLHAADGTVSLLMAALRLPPGDQPTSDVVGSTLCVPINLATGILGDAECGRLELGPCKRHPFNGVEIAGRVIPEWPRMCALALEAHRKLPFMPSIGWDLVATDAGVFILEANAVWNANLAQHWGRVPLGETTWPEVMLTASPALMAHGKPARAERATSPA